MEDKKRVITFEVEVDICDFLAEELHCMLAGTLLFGKCISEEDRNDEEVALKKLAERLKQLIIEKVGINKEDIKVKI